MSTRQGREGTVPDLAQAREERVGKTPRIMDDWGKNGRAKTEERAMPTGTAKAARTVMRENRVHSVLRLGQAGDIGLLIVAGHGGIIPGEVPICSTSTISNRYTAHAPHLATMFPRKGRAPPVPNTGMGGVDVFAVRSVNLRIGGHEPLHLDFAVLR